MQSRAGFFISKISIISAKNEEQMKFNSRYGDIKCKNSEMKERRMRPK